MRSLILSFLLIVVGCTSPNSARTIDKPQEKIKKILTYKEQQEQYKQKLNALITMLPQQSGRTAGYPEWYNTIVLNEPASSIIALGPDSRVMSALTEKISDYSSCNNCEHRGRSGPGDKLYCVSDIVCYIMMEFHTLKSQELVFEELERRKLNKKRIAPVVWAIRYHHLEMSFSDRLNEGLPVEQE